VPDEESLQALRRDVLGDAFGVAAVARELQRFVVDVPGEDQHPRARVLPQNLLSDQDRQRVRFLAGRAAGRPHPEGPVQLCDVHEARDHITGEYGECLRVPEEVRHADEQIAEQLVRLARAIVQALDVRRDRCRLEHLHAPLDAPHQRRRLIAPEVMPRLVQQDRADAGQLVAARQDERFGPLLVAQAAQVGGILHQLVGQLRRGKHVIHEAGGDRAPEHGIVLRRLRGLRHDHAAVLLHGAQADRSVGSRPGKEHAHGIVALILGERVEQAVDR